MFGKRRGFGRGLGHRNQFGNKCHRFKNREYLSLNQAELGKKYIIVCNPNRKTFEMGIFVGGVITVQKDDFTDNNIVVGVGNSRYIIPRELAEQILIQ